MKESGRYHPLGYGEWKLFRYLPSALSCVVRRTQVRKLQWPCWEISYRVFCRRKYEKSSNCECLCSEIKRANLEQTSHKWDKRRYWNFSITRYGSSFVISTNNKLLEHREKNTIHNNQLKTKLVVMLTRQQIKNHLLPPSTQHSKMHVIFYPST